MFNVLFSSHIDDIFSDLLAVCLFGWTVLFEMLKNRAAKLSF